MLGIKKFGKTLQNIALRKTDVLNWLLLRVVLTSKKEKESFFANSEVNLKNNSYV